MEIQPKQKSQNTAQEKINLNSEEHESRQNIVGDAKIATEKLRTNLQNLSQQVTETMDKLKSKNQTAGERSAVFRTDVFDQGKLTSQGKDIASTYRTNQDPNFSRSNTEEMPAVIKENLQEGVSQNANANTNADFDNDAGVKSTERVITPHDDRVITTEGEKITSAYPITKELKKGLGVVETKLNENTDFNIKENAEKGKMREQNKSKDEKKVM